MIWRFITDFGDSAVTVTLAAAIILVLAATRRPRSALAVALAVGACGAAMMILKLALETCGHRAFDPALRNPSGHMAMSVVVYGVLALLLGAAAGRSLRMPILAAAAALNILVGISRLALHTHSLVEILIGLAVGLAALAGFHLLFARRQPGAAPAGWLALASLLVLVLMHGRHWDVESAILHAVAYFHSARHICT